MRVGRSLRAARQGRGWTLAALAEAGGVSKGFVSQVENDKTSPSLDTLERLAGALGLTVVDLLGSAAAAPAPHTVRGALVAPPEAGEGAHITRPELGHLRPLSAAAAMAPSVQEISPPGSLLRSFVVDLPPGTSLGEPGHHHAGEESLVVVRGHCDADQAGAVVHLAAGDALSWTPGQPHRLLNRSPEPARLLITLLAPATLGASGVLGPPARHGGPAPQGRALRLVQMRAARDRRRSG